MAENELEAKTNLLNLPIEDWLEEAKKAVKERNMATLEDLDRLFVRFFCKNVAKQKIEELGRYNKLIVNILSWFEWGGKKKWDDAAALVDKWKIILELSQKIMETESPQKAYKEIKKSSYGNELLELLYEKKLLKPSEIRKELGIKSMQQVSKLLSKFEKCGIVTREVDGKNVWVSLGIQGIAVYKEYIEPRKTGMWPVILKPLQMYENNELDKAKKELRHLMKEAPDNPLVVCLLGIIDLEQGDLFGAGEFFTRAVKIGIEKENALLLFFVLDKMHRMQWLVNKMYEMNFQNDQVLEKIRPALSLYGMVHEYMGNESRANEYYRLQCRPFLTFREKVFFSGG